MSLLLFIVLLVVAVFFLSCSIFMLCKVHEGGILLLFVTAIFLFISVVGPIQRVEDTQIMKPDLLFNTNGAVVAYNDTNYTFKEFKVVEDLRAGVLVPFERKKYNFYGCVAYTDLVLKSPEK